MGKVALLIILTVSYLLFWLLHFQPQIVPRSELTKVTGTFKVPPKYESGSGGDPGAVFTLNEYNKLEFGIPGGLYEVLDKDIFKYVKQGDSVTFLVKTKIYNKRISQNSPNNFITNFLDGAHINFYDLVVAEKNYMPLNSFNRKVAEDNNLKNIIAGILFLLLCLNLYISFRERRKSAAIN